LRSIRGTELKCNENLYVHISCCKCKRGGWGWVRQCFKDLNLQRAISVYVSDIIREGSDN